MRPGWSFTSAPEFLLVAAGAVVVAACSAQTSDPTPATTDAARPNIIVVMVDDLRWDEFGAAGHPFVQTPNIDRIADEGVMFRNAFATTPICSPSRASFLTGQYVHTNGIIDNTDRSARSHEMPTFPQALQRAGYDTAFVGKWHMGNDHSPRPGFDYWVAMPGQGEAIGATPSRGRISAGADAEVPRRPNAAVRGVRLAAVLQWEPTIRRLEDLVASRLEPTRSAASAEDPPATPCTQGQDTPPTPPWRAPR